jgi:hypothetical protein
MPPGSTYSASGSITPMTLGLIRGSPARAKPLFELYRQARAQSGQPAWKLKAGLVNHFFVGATSQGARDTLFPHYRDYLAPKTPGGRGFIVDRFMGQVDLGGLPRDTVMDSIELFATEVAPVIRRELPQ